MIITNFWLERGLSYEQQEFHLHIEAVVNNSFDLMGDVEVLVNTLLNSDFDPKPETLYQLIFERASINADPVNELGFSLEGIEILETFEGHVIPKMINI